MTSYHGGLPPHALETIGAVTTAWGDLENQVTQLVAFVASPGHPDAVERLVHLDPISARLNKLKILTNTLGFAPGQEAVDSVYAQWPDHLREQIRAFVRAVESLRDLRNSIVHSSWRVRTDDEFIYASVTTRGRTHFRHSHQEWTQDQLEGLLADVIEASATGGRLWAELFTHWAAANPDRVASLDDAIVAGTGEIIRGGAAERDSSDESAPPFND